MHVGCGFSLRGGREAVGVVFTTEDQVLILAMANCPFLSLTLQENNFIIPSQKNKKNYALVSFRIFAHQYL